MEKVKIFSDTTVTDVEDTVNKWIAEHLPEIIDRKMALTPSPSYDITNIVICTIAIFYNER